MAIVIKKNKYPITFSAGTTSPADSTNYQLGAAYGSTWSTTDNTRVLRCQEGTITELDFNFVLTATASGNEDTPISIRINSTTDYFIGNIKFNATFNTYKFTGLNISTLSTDYFTIKIGSVVYSVNPTGIFVTGSVTYSL